MEEKSKENQLNGGQVKGQGFAPSPSTPYAHLFEEKALEENYRSLIGDV